MLSIYPNPSKDFINVDFDLLEDEKVSNISIFDIRGGLIQNNVSLEINEQGKLNVNYLSNGSYILIIDTNMRRLSSKFSVLK